MKSLAHALNSAVPRFQQFRMRQSKIAPANDFCLLLLSQFTRLIANQLATVLFKPNCQSLPFLGCQAKNRLFQLLQAHDAQVYCEPFIPSTAAFDPRKRSELKYKIDIE